MTYWWMSFCDHDLPSGEKFLGALIVKADTVEEMVNRSWELGLNPGGEILFFAIIKEYEKRIPLDWIETKLITKEEAGEFEKRWKGLS